ncbi:MAG: hypothetical protein AAF721_00330 [Myxococcota bacterium]
MKDKTLDSTAIRLARILKPVEWRQLRAVAEDKLRRRGTMNSRRARQELERLGLLRRNAQRHRVVTELGRDVLAAKGGAS